MDRWFVGGRHRRGGSAFPPRWPVPWSSWLPHWADDHRVTVATGDLTDPPVLDEVLHTEPDVVFNLAGILGSAAEASAQQLTGGCCQPQSHVRMTV
ncbi:hypothetical protein D3I60_14375 [Brevibacterium permense]|nr:hypothetical protein [Brevibacterium permense]